MSVLYREAFFCVSWKPSVYEEQGERQVNEQTVRNNTPLSSLSSSMINLVQRLVCTRVTFLVVYSE